MKKYSSVIAILTALLLALAFTGCAPEPFPDVSPWLAQLEAIPGGIKLEVQGNGDWDDDNNVAWMGNGLVGGSSLLTFKLSDLGLDDLVAGDAIIIKYHLLTQVPTAKVTVKAGFGAWGTDNTGDGAGGQYKQLCDEFDVDINKVRELKITLDGVCVGGDGVSLQAGDDSNGASAMWYIKIISVEEE